MAYDSSPLSPERNQMADAAKAMENLSLGCPTLALDLPE
jgi:hypothetical protein